MSSVYLDPKIWGPHYWFFIHTVAMTYPVRPNAITKKSTMNLFKIYQYLFQLKTCQESLVNYLINIL